MKTNRIARGVVALLISICSGSHTIAQEAAAGMNPKVTEAFGNLPPDYSDAPYQEALTALRAMLTGEEKMSFKRAVFLTENAYFENRLSYQKFNDKVNWLTALCQHYKQANPLLYEHADKEAVATSAAIFKVMTDTTLHQLDSARYWANYPFSYDFEDIWGEQAWTQMFVTKLLVTRSGNCHSLPLLYKIVAEELGIRAYLSIAPNHLYIKHRCSSIGWYNTELTNPSFPVDAWIMASGYVPTDAVISGIYMDTLSEQQSIAVCLTDLANGYEKKFGVKDGKFILQCCELALQHYPNYVNALLLKAETLKKVIEGHMAQHGATYPKEVFHLPDVQRQFTAMEETYVQIHRSGYRRMPKEMYLQWLAELNAEKEKYANKQMSRALTDK